MAFHRYADRRSEFALHFILLSAAVFALAGTIGWGLVRLTDAARAGAFRFPPAFWVSTLMLLTGSIAMQRAVGFVLREKQRPFRMHLLVALFAGMFFVAFQIDAIWFLIHSHEQEFARATSEAATALGVKPYVLVAAALHAMHFFLAMLFVVYVTLNGLAGRYDHEYCWGVRVCAFFWHGLGLVWLAILCVFAIVVNGT